MFDFDFRQKIIDTFINSVYLFDNKVVMYYNIKDAKQVSYIDMLNDLEESDKTQTEEQPNDCSPVRISDEMVHQSVLNPNIYRFINRRFFIVLKK